jgi:hypothetical protein
MSIAWFDFFPTPLLIISSKVQHEASCQTNLFFKNHYFVLLWLTENSPQAPSIDQAMDDDYAMGSCTHRYIQSHSRPQQLRQSFFLFYPYHFWIWPSNLLEP